MVTLQIQRQGEAVCKTDASSHGPAENWQSFYSIPNEPSTMERQEE
jgi:hypothetical protein